MEFHVAPMKGITNWEFRRKCRGATDSYTEMIQLRDILANKVRAKQKLDLFHIEGQNQWIQILTNSIRDMAKLPAYLGTFSKNFPDQSHIFGINLNVGCPDPQIISAGQGASLIKRRKRLQDLIKAFFTSVDHPYHLSIKFRLGMHMGDVNMKVLVDVLENLSVIDDNRLDPPIIHFKHAKQQSDEEPIWEFLDSLLDAEYPFILNGNIKTPQDIHNIKNRLDARRRDLFEKHVKGIMLGRALLFNSSLFLEFRDEFDQNS
ncbi:MAG: tRNA-dihydrouridine synthase family protein [Promethearchaeota archaeon]